MDPETYLKNVRKPVYTISDFAKQMKPLGECTKNDIINEINRLSNDQKNAYKLKKALTNYVFNKYVDSWTKKRWIRYFNWVDEATIIKDNTKIKIENYVTKPLIPTKDFRKTYEEEKLALSNSPVIPKIEVFDKEKYEAEKKRMSEETVPVFTKIYTYKLSSDMGQKELNRGNWENDGYVEPGVFRVRYERPGPTTSKPAHTESHIEQLSTMRATSFIIDEVKQQQWQKVKEKKSAKVKKIEIALKKVDKFNRYQILESLNQEIEVDSFIEEKYTEIKEIGIPGRKTHRFEEKVKTKKVPKKVKIKPINKMIEKINIEFKSSIGRDKMKWMNKRAMITADCLFSAVKNGFLTKKDFFAAKSYRKELQKQIIKYLDKIKLLVER